MPRTNPETIIIGGGVSGLAAAAFLARHKAKVTLLEARERLGGRIFTRRIRGWKTPVELGAEFVHEGNAPLWHLMQKLRLRVRRVPNRHRLFTAGTLERREDLAALIGRVTGKIHPAQVGNASFAMFLRRVKGHCTPAEIDATVAFVQGFEAASVRQMSARALAGETLDTTHQFYLPQGYDHVVSALEAQLLEAGGRYVCRRVVTHVHWRRNHVQVTALNEGGEEEQYVGDAAIVTLPLGVLQAKPPRQGAVRFSPCLRQRAALIARMGVGHVARVVIRFDAQRWRALLPHGLKSGATRPLGFLHSHLEGVPVWWSLSAPNILTGWAGAPSAEKLNHRPRSTLITTALDSLAALFDVAPQALRQAVSDFQFHNWTTDPFSRGAYSFVHAGLDDAPARLRTPVQRTLFFAGEATADGAEIGTVHGALASGLRAARQILATK